MVQKYRKKPVVIEAVQFFDDAATIATISDFVGVDLRVNYENNLPRMFIETLEGIMAASPGDYIIKGIKGEFYACKPDIFEASYDLVTETVSW